MSKYGYRGDGENDEVIKLLLGLIEINDEKLKSFLERCLDGGVERLYNESDYSEYNELWDYDCWPNLHKGPMLSDLYNSNANIKKLSELERKHS